MNKTIIIIGESASINEELISKYGFKIVPFKVDWPEQDFFSGKDIFEKMRDSGEKGVPSAPKTSQPSLGSFKNVFTEALKEGEDAVYISLGSAISGTYNSAIQAQKMLPEGQKGRIFIVDSQNADAAETLLGIKAAELAAEGKNGKEIKEELEKYVQKTYLFGMVENPKWLEVGGRIGQAAKTMLIQMQKLGMRPVLHIKDGIIKPANLKMNARDTAEALFKHFKASIEKDKNYLVAITHADNRDTAERLAEMIEKEYSQRTEVILINKTGLAIGPHVGPGTIICAIIEK